MLVEVNCNICDSSERRLLFKKDGFHIVRCKRCGLVYVNPRIANDNLTEQYTQEYYSGEYYTAKSFMDKRPQNVIKKLYTDILDELSRQMGGKVGSVLDLGCGVGNFLDAARERKWTIAGIDVSPFAAEYAKKRLGGAIKTGSVDRVDFPDKSFDAVSIISVIEHVPDPRKTLREMRRLLKPDGIAVISTINFSGISNLLFGKLSYGIEPDEHIYYFTPRTINELLATCGFKTVRVETRHIYLYNFFLLFEILFRRKRNNKMKLYRKTYHWIQNNALSLMLIRSINRILNTTGRGDNLIVFARKDERDEI